MQMQAQTRLLIGAMWVFAGACAPAVMPGYLVGDVHDEQGRAVKDAIVTLLPNTRGTTNSTGAFRIEHAVAHSAHATILQISAQGYAAQTMSLDANDFQTVIHVVVHATDRVTTVSLPAPGDAPLVISVDAPTTAMPQGSVGGTSALKIGPGAMVLPDGSTATGEVQIAMSYWNTLGDLRGIPGTLFAAPNVPGGMPLPLQSWGIASIEVSQGNTLLQVAPGQTLTWEVTLPPALKTTFVATTASTSLSPYFEDVNTGFWEKYGSATYDPARGVIVNLLPHLCGVSTDIPDTRRPEIPVDPCLTAQAKHLGDPCQPGDLCCPRDSLVCSDNLCVPTADMP